MDEEKGLVCGLTNEYADLEGRCENFTGDEYEIELKNLQKIRDGSRTIIAVLCVIIALIWIPAIFYMINEPYAGQMFVLLSSVTGTLAAVFSVFWVLRVMKINRKDDRLTIDRIKDCIRKEGYYPVVNGNMAGFKIQGHSFFVAYDPIRLQIGYISRISNDGNIAAAREAALYVMDSLFLNKVRIEPDNDGFDVRLCINVWITSSSEFERFFPGYVSALIDGVNNYSEAYSRILSARQEDLSQMESMYYNSNVTSVPLRDC